MASLKERLAAKKKRRVVLPVTVAEATDEEAARLTLAQAQLLKAISEGKDTADLEAEVEAAKEANQVDVAFTATDPDTFEKVIANYQGEDGIDRERALPVVAALCADDPELQDDEWWTAELSSGKWNHGERLALWRALLHINSSSPNPYVPKD